MTENEYTILKQFTRTFIDLSISRGKELKPEDIDSYHALQTGLRRSRKDTHFYRYGV